MQNPKIHSKVLDLQNEFTLSNEGSIYKYLKDIDKLYTQEKYEKNRFDKQAKKIMTDFNQKIGKSMVKFHTALFKIYDGEYKRK
jgi:hypothetical protein